ncbi:MAG TPA: cytochrome C oxidase subunit IV family protein [Planctomycetota bacterium]|jgi:cytochrome c oxidase subunit 4|nr:cytochrome C oxidase subunit IV family protein [Planctomycetota bacterium]
MSPHVVPLKTYFTIFGALMAGTALTVFVAFQDLGPMNTVVALTIAAIKALLVVLFFMHVKYSSRLTWVFAAAGFLWLVLMIGLTMADFDTRGMS